MTEAMDTWITTPVTAELLRGALEVESTDRGVLPHRLPASARARIPDGQLAMAEAQPSGVRIVFRSRATAVALDVVATKRVYAGAPPRPDGLFELLVGGSAVGRASVRDGDVLAIDMATGAAELRPGPVRTVRFDSLPSGDKAVEIWLPHDESVRLIALRTDAPVVPVPQAGRKVWMHHGSSISQGSNTDRPTGTWPALAAARGGVDLVNLGFSGSALLDPFTARAMRDAPADFVSVKVGINIVNTDAMRLRTFTPAVHGFLDTIRDGHPATPLLLVSPLYCGIHETTPGPSAVDASALHEGRLRFAAEGDPADIPAGKLTLAVIRAELARVVAERADPHLHHLDGRELYGPADAEELPLPDDLHPDAAAHRLIGDRFARHAFASEGPFRE